MPQIGFKPTTPVFEQTKAVHALDGAATSISVFQNRSRLRETWDQELDAKICLFK
jgi:hypothetical protein